MTATSLDRQLTRTDDPDEVAHVADKGDTTRAYVEGTPLTALCGYVWVPSRNPEGLPVCQRCSDLREQIRHRGAN